MRSIRQQCAQLAMAVALLALVAVAAAPAKAALLGYDGFETYTAGQALAGKNGGLGFTAAWASNSQPVVSNASLQYVNGQLAVDGGSKAVKVFGPGETLNVDNIANRRFATQTGPVYWSLLFRVDDATGDNDFIQFILSNDTDHDNSGSYGYRRKADPNTTQGFFARVRSTSDQTYNTSQYATTGQTYFLVGKFFPVGASYAQTDLWVNPTTATEPTGPSDYWLHAWTQKDSQTNNLAYFLIRTAFYESNQSFTFDELRIGTSYADVVTAVPEPSTALLFAAGVVAGLFVLRRRVGA